MIFEMEPHSQTLFNDHQSIKLNGILVSKNLSPASSNSSENKFANSKPSTSGVISHNSSENAQKHKEFSNQLASNSQNPKSNGLHNSSQKSSSFIGPILPQKLLEKPQPRLVLHTKNGKVLNGSSLVPYDGSSDDEENNSGNTSKTSNSENSTNLKPNPFNSSNVQKMFSSRMETSPKPGTNSKDSSQSNGSSCAISSSVKPLNGLLPFVKLQNGASNGNGVSKQSSPKHQNGKSESNGKLESNGKDKRLSQIKIKTGEDVKLAASSNGWEVSKDTLAPSSVAIPNGWSVTDNNQ